MFEALGEFEHLLTGRCDVDLKEGRSAVEADLEIEAQVEALLDGWEAAFGGDAEIQALFGSRKTSPVVLNYIHAVAIVERFGRPVPTTLRFTRRLAGSIKS